LHVYQGSPKAALFFGISIGQVYESQSPPCSQSGIGIFLSVLSNS